MSITSSAFLGAGGHAHERLVRMFHRRIGDAQVALADRVIVGFHDMMGRLNAAPGIMWLSLWNIARSSSVGLRRTSSRSRRNGAPVIGTKIECLPPSRRSFWVAGVIGEIAGNCGNQFTHQLPIQIDQLAFDLGTGSFSSLPKRMGSRN